MQSYVYQCGEREIHGHLSCIIQKRHHQFWLALKLGCRCTRFFVFRIFRLFVFSHSIVSDSPWSHGLYVACQAPLSMKFYKQEYWSRLPLPTPGDPPHQGMEPMSPALAGGFLITKPQTLTGITLMRTSGTTY